MTTQEEMYGSGHFLHRHAVNTLVKITFKYNLLFSTPSNYYSLKCEQSLYMQMLSLY